MCSSNGRGDWQGRAGDGGERGGRAGVVIHEEPRRKVCKMALATKSDQIFFGCAVLLDLGWAEECYARPSLLASKLHGTSESIPATYQQARGVMSSGVLVTDHTGTSKDPENSLAIFGGKWSICVENVRRQFWKLYVNL